ncbi:MAG: FkbM family methyltransferase [Planctomycetota bacterium]
MRFPLLRLLRDLLKEVLRRQRVGASCYLGDGVVLTRVRGFKMVCPGDDLGLTPHLVLDGGWELATTRVLERCVRRGMTVLDIGANIGYFTLTAARSVGPGGRVIAFEPEPRNLYFLRHNVALNGLTWVDVVGRGLWNEAGTRTMRKTPGSSGGHTVVNVDPASLSDEERVEVAVTTLDTYLAESRGGDLGVDVIKMDAEGAEPFIWEGMTRTLAANPRLTVLMEFGPDFLRGAGRDVREYLEGIEAMGFSIGLIDHDFRVKPLELDRLEAWIAARAWPQMLLLERG